MSLLGTAGAPAHALNWRAACSRQRLSCCRPSRELHAMPTSLSRGCCSVAMTCAKALLRRSTMLALQAGRPHGQGERGEGGEAHTPAPNARRSKSLPAQWRCRPVCCNLSSQWHLDVRGRLKCMAAACTHKRSECLRQGRCTAQAAFQLLDAAHRPAHPSGISQAGSSCDARSAGTSTELSSSPSRATSRSGTRSAGTSVLSSADRLLHFQRHRSPRFSADGRGPAGPAPVRHESQLAERNTPPVWFPGCPAPGMHGRSSTGTGTQPACPLLDVAWACSSSSPAPGKPEQSQGRWGGTHLGGAPAQPAWPPVTP